MLKNPGLNWSLGIDIDLLPLIVRYGEIILLSSSYQPSFAPHDSLQEHEHMRWLHEMPTEFNSLKQAWLYWEILTRRFLNWLADCNYKSSCDPSENVF